MTGFARVEGGDEALSWVWEARSVNGKGLDIRTRLPQGFDTLEQAAREAADKVMARGNVTVSLNLTHNTETQGLAINEAAFVRVAALARELKDMEGIDPPTLDGLLRLPGVLDSSGQNSNEVDEDKQVEIRSGLNAVLQQLAEQRAGEGARLLVLLTSLLDEIAAGSQSAAATAGAHPGLIRERLIAQINELTQGQHPVTEERLAQEVTMLATKADVREEIDRLNIHIAAVRDLLGGDAAPGRRLGFLCQELLREANTLCSKSSDKDLTAIGLDLKVAIDRLREQALNVE
ncbi:MAG: YicC family protein [Alphaproteobacteria bacterium]|jgi:uncharacterized protein (TIGR00255 family)|nr:YicC family protein [Rhodospirillaceae bacterium]MBT7647889.1 YicC family protein [Rhodospirillaceae bacterium]MDG2481284.1 YicC family protein [Alphaproteobacteria bacterium]